MIGQPVVQRSPEHDNRLPRVGRARRIHQPRGKPIDEGEQQLVVTADVAVERHRRHAEPPPEPSHRHSLDALGVEQARRCVEHLVTVERGRAPAPPAVGGLCVHLCTCTLSRVPPTLATGKICYLEIPAVDLERSSRFYRDAFAWKLRTRGDGSLAFDDAVEEVSGTWVTGRPPSAEPAIMVYVMVADIVAALAGVRAAGGEVVLDVDPAARERVAHVRDPAGNLVGVYEQPGLAVRERAVAPVPEHLHTVTPRLVLGDATAAIDFYVEAFAATELGERHCAPDGTLIHAELRIGDSVVMVTEGEGFNALLCTYWPDVDAAWERALAAGAQIVYPLADHFYGERGGRVQDPFGQQWMLSARLEKLNAAEITARAQAHG